MPKRQLINRWQSPEERFFKQINKDPISGCWLWIGAIGGTGYGCIKVKGRNTRAHRFSYELHYKPIPDGFCVCHKCDVRHCVNPDHLFIGTIDDNNKDRLNKNGYILPKGEKCGRAKLTEKQAIEIKYSNLKNSELAKKYHVSRPTISTITHGINWKHI